MFGCTAVNAGREDCWFVKSLFRQAARLFANQAQIHLVKGSKEELKRPFLLNGNSNKTSSQIDR